MEINFCCFTKILFLEDIKSCYVFSSTVLKCGNLNNIFIQIQNGWQFDFVN